MTRRLYHSIKEDLNEKIVLLSGPRQVGKTTLSRSLYKNHDYLNYDASDDRLRLKKEEWNRKADLVVFDELHKMKKWKAWIKGVYDTEGVTPRLIITGSARMDIYKKGGDSLAGRYFNYRLHPFTVKELKNKMNATEVLGRLLKHGGFPEPFTKNSQRASRRWRKTHLEKIMRDDVRDLSNVRELKLLETMVELLRLRVGSTVSYTSLAEDLQVSVPTVKSWLTLLENFYIIFPVRPYSKKIARSLLKDSKYYFYDTGAVKGDEGTRLENTIACALRAELDFLEDTEGFDTALHFLRDKEGHEVDFIAFVDGKPLHMLEVKWSDNNFSKSLFHFLKYIKPKEVFQVVYAVDKKRSAPPVHLMSAVEYLENINLNPS